MNHGWIRLAMVCVLLVGRPTSVVAQMLAGAWVKESEQRIDERRKTDLRVIVLDAIGKPAPGVSVRIEQTRSDFHLGVVLPETGWTYQADAWQAHEPFWRCINAVSLERMTAWPVLEPDRGGSFDEQRTRFIDRTLGIAEARGMFVRWGPLISADPGRAPGWAATLEGDVLAQAVRGYSHAVWRRYAGRVHQYDVYTQTLDHSFMENKAGTSLIRVLYETLPVVSDGAVACARFDDAIVIGRLQLMQRQLTTMREAFIPVGCVAIDHRFNGVMERQQLERLISRIDAIKKPVVISGLTVGGDSLLNASISLETVLRTLMERPNLQGIWFADLAPDDAVDPNSALIDTDGQPTASGSLIDGLYHDLWRTNIKTQTDELGNVRARAFPGEYRIRATLKGGAVLETEIRLVMSPEPRVVLMEPLRPGAANMRVQE